MFKKPSFHHSNTADALHFSQFEPDHEVHSATTVHSDEAGLLRRQFDRQ